MMYSKALIPLIGCLLVACQAKVDNAWRYTGGENLARSIIWSAEKIELTHQKDKLSGWGKLMGSRTLRVHPDFRQKYETYLAGKMEEPDFKLLCEENDESEVFNLPENPVTVLSGDLVTTSNVGPRDARTHFKRCLLEFRVRMLRNFKTSSDGFRFLAPEGGHYTPEILSENLSTIAKFWELLEVILNPFQTHKTSDNLQKYFDVASVIKDAELTEAESEYLKTCMTIKSCTSHPEDMSKASTEKVEKCYDDIQLYKCLNLAKEIRYKILMRKGGEELANGAKDVKIPKWLKNDANEPQKLMDYHTKHAFDLEAIFGTFKVGEKVHFNSISGLTAFNKGDLEITKIEGDMVSVSGNGMQYHVPKDQLVTGKKEAAKIVDLYEEMLFKQNGANVDDYNDLGTLQKIIIDAFKDLHNIARKSTQDIATKYESIREKIDDFDVHYNARAVRVKKATAARLAKEKSERDEAKRVRDEKDAERKRKQREAREARQRKKKEEREAAAAARKRPRKRTKLLTLKQLDEKLTAKFKKVKNEHKNLDLFKDWMKNHPKHDWPEKPIGLKAFAPFLTEYLEAPVSPVMQ